MRDYRLYCLDGVKRIARAAEVIQAESDEEATAAAQALGLEMRCELWEGRRLVTTLPAAEPKP